MRLKTEKLVYGGDGLGRLPADEHGSGKTVFIPFVLEGEEVEASLVEQKPGFARGRLERVLSPSTDRIEPGCRYFRHCGGCHYQHANYQRQLEIKAAILREILRRTAKVELPVEIQIHPSPEWNYRNRSRLKVQTEPTFALGYHKHRSHDLLPVEECPISSPLINQTIAKIWSWGRSTCIPGELREIEIFANHDDRTLMIEAYIEPRTLQAQAEAIVELLARAVPEAVGLTAFEQLPSNRAHMQQAGDPKRLASVGASELNYQMGRTPYRVSAGSFFQVNRFLIDDLTSIVTIGRSGRLALDLYAGVGLFSAILARSFAQVIAVESSQTSHSDLRHNCPPEVKAVRATTEKYLEKASGVRPDLVVADPPRSGLGENVVRSLAKVGAPRITYVSCDPSTLARDLRDLLRLGYRIEGVHLIDLFPQTYHIESVFHLAR
jgi:23S rRNA (uracil1939-C5)-methyltransferase